MTGREGRIEMLDPKMALGGKPYPPFMTPDLLREFDPGAVVELSPLVRRITAPNPGMMTGPGTNCFLIGRDEVAVIDPGIADAGHVERIVAAGGGRIRWILVTHTHPDHSPAARPLAERTGAPVFSHPARLRGIGDHGFKADLHLDDGQSVRGPGFTLRCLHTPGHASNHLCYLLEEEGLLFAGDQVMYGSTVVIAPPDGDMGAYLDALRRLLAEPIAAIAPAHGRVMQSPTDVLQGIIDHRLAREAKVIAALSDARAATIEQLLPCVYDDVPQVLHPAAAMSLFAHLLKLRQDGRAQGEDAQSVWEWVS